MAPAHGHQHVSSALSAGGMAALDFGGDTASFASDGVIVCLASDGTYLTVQFTYGWLSLDSGDTASDEDYVGEVAGALNSGGIPAIIYAGDDADHVNTILTGGMTINVSTGWPSEPDSA